MTMGHAIAAMLSAKTEKQRKAAAKELVQSQKALTKELESQGCRITFGPSEPTKKKAKS